MSTNTAASQIHDAYKKEKPQMAAPQPIAMEYVNRYIWFPAEDIPYPEANAGYIAILRERAQQLNYRNIQLAGGFIERMRVTPVLPAPYWERIFDVPDEMRRNLRGQKANGDYEEALYYVPPGHIFDGIMDSYRLWGVTELQALRGMEVEELLDLRIDETFFPEEKDLTRIGNNGKTIDETPRRYSLMRARIAETLAEAPPKSAIYQRIAGDMLTAIEVATAFDTALVDEEETRNPLRYSNHGLRALHRLERQRRDHAMNEMAKRQESALDVIGALPDVLRAAQGNGGITADVLEKILARQQEQFNAILERMGAQQLPPVEVKPEIKPPATKK